MPRTLPPTAVAPAVDPRFHVEQGHALLEQARRWTQGAADELQPLDIDLQPQDDGPLLFVVRGGIFPALEGAIAHYGAALDAAAAGEAAALKTQVSARLGLAEALNLHAEHAGKVQQAVVGDYDSRFNLDRIPGTAAALEDPSMAPYLEAARASAWHSARADNIAAFGERLNTIQRGLGFRWMQDRISTAVNSVSDGAWASLMRTNALQLFAVAPYRER